MKVQSFVLCFLLTLLSVSCIREDAQCGSGYLIVYGRWRYIESRAGDRQRVRDADREK